jgi:hypothetical protein
MHDSDDITVFEEGWLAGQDDVFGIARYLADAVSGGEITLDDGARALAEWADETVLSDVAAHLSAGSDTEHLVQAATEWRAA